MIGLGWVMMYNSIVEKCLDNKHIDNKNEMEKTNNINNIIIINKI
jgi:hypothetical protein